MAEDKTSGDTIASDKMKDSAKSAPVVSPQEQAQRFPNGTEANDGVTTLSESDKAASKGDPEPK